MSPSLSVVQPPPPQSCPFPRKEKSSLCQKSESRYTLLYSTPPPPSHFRVFPVRSHDADSGPVLHSIAEGGQHCGGWTTPVTTRSAFEHAFGRRTNLPPTGPTSSPPTAVPFGSMRGIRVCQVAIPNSHFSRALATLPSPLSSADTSSKLVERPAQFIRACRSSDVVAHDTPKSLRFHR